MKFRLFSLACQVLWTQISVPIPSSCLLYGQEHAVFLKISSLNVKYNVYSILSYTCIDLYQSLRKEGKKFLAPLLWQAQRKAYAAKMEGHPVEH